MVLHKSFSPVYQWLIIPKNTTKPGNDWKLLSENRELSLYQNNRSLTPESTNSLKIQIEEDSCKIQNDPFGIHKFFFFHNPESGFFAASDNIWVLAAVSDLKINRTSCADLLLFNYFRKGNTFFENIFYAEPGSCLVFENKTIYYDSYSLQGISDTNTPIISNSGRTLSIDWLNTLKSLYTPAGHYGITLTGGYDSRMILAGLKTQDIKLTALTFGHPESDDALIASIIAVRLGLPHHIDSPDEAFYENFEKQAMEAVMLSGGLLNPLRMVRLGVFEQWTGYDGIFFGYAGSELLRGLYFDSLLSSRFFYQLNTRTFNKQEMKQFIRESLNEYFMIPEESQVDSLAEEYLENPEYHQPFPHLMNTIIPMHFGEDLRYLSMKGIRAIAPFLHPGFYNSLLLNNCIGLLRQKKAFQNKPSMESPIISASIITKLDKQLAGIPLTKGFSPRDYVFSKYYAGIKWIWHNKLKKRKKQPVTILWPWYKEFLQGFIHREDSIYFEYDKKRMLAALEKHTGNNEAGYLPYTRFLHLRLMEKALMKNTRHE